ncbi:unnamed protein product, partial [Prorocentrum cordatum]
RRSSSSQVLPPAAAMEDASLLSRALFLWFQPTMVAGFKAPLQRHDAPPLPTFLDPDSLYKDFDRCWLEELARAKERNRLPSMFKLSYRLLRWDVLRAVVLQVTTVICRFGSVLVLRRFVQIIMVLEVEESLFKEGLFSALCLFVLAVFVGTLEPLATQQCQFAAYRLYASIAMAVRRKGAELHPGVQ